MTHELTRADLYLQKIKNHKVLSVLIVAGIVIAAISAFISQLDSGYSAIKNRTTAKTTEIENPITPANTTLDQSQNPVKTQENHGQCADCQRLYEAALENIKNGQITKPTDNNAYQKYLKINETDKNLSKTLLTIITNDLSRRAFVALQENNAQKSKSLLKTLKSINTEFDPTPLQLKIAEMERTRKKTSTSAPTLGTNTTNNNFPKGIKEGDTGQSVSAEVKNQEINIDSTKEPTKNTTLPATIASTQEIQQPHAIRVSAENSRTATTSAPVDENIITEEWTDKACKVVTNILTDSSKLTAIRSLIKDKNRISTSQVFKLYRCAKILTDSSKVELLRTLTGRETSGRLTPEQLEFIIQSILTDTSKNSATALLSRFL